MFMSFKVDSKVGLLSSNNTSKNNLDKMADDPFSIWGEPPTTTTTATASTSNINDTSKSSLDFFDSLAGASTSTSTSSHQPSTKLFADDSLSNDATWGQPPSPAAIPEKERDEDEDLIPEIDNIHIQDKIQHPESSLGEAEQIQIPAEPKEEINGTGQDENAVETAPEVKQIETQEDQNPIASTTAHPSDSSHKEDPIEQDDFHATENINPEAEVKVEEQEQQSSEPLTTTFISPPPASSTNPVPPDDDFDDFDDFGESSGNVVGEADDDFGDFGDFDDGSLSKEEPLQIQREQVAQQQQQQQPPTNAANWSCLQVDLDSTSESVSAQIRELLSPPLASGSNSYPYHEGSGDVLGNEKLRQVEGNSQVLVSEKSRQSFSQLSKLPSLQPISWTRSLTRRSSLISLGIPINLDEVSTSSSGMGGKSTLPPLALTLDSTVPRESGPSSAPASDGSRGPPKRSQSGLVPGDNRNSNSNVNTPRTGSPAPGRNGERLAERRREELGLGPAPELDWKRAEELVAMTEDQLTLQSLPALRSLSRELHSLTTTSSTLLTHHLTLRESHAADAEMYDSMIRDLVAGASNRLSSDKSSSKGDRRATTIGLGTSNSKHRSASGGSAMAHSSSQQRINGGNSGRNSPRPSSPAVNSPKR